MNVMMRKRRENKMMSHIKKGHFDPFHTRLHHDKGLNKIYTVNVPF